MGYNSTYDILVDILKSLENGGGKVVLHNGTRLGYSGFKTVPEVYDFSYITNFSNMFNNCTSLTTIPLFDTSKCTNFSSMFNNCISLTTIPLFDVSNGTYFNNMFNSCSKLTTIPQLDVSNGTNFSNMFYYCRLLTTIQQFDVSNGTNFSGMFGGCSALENITLTGSINYNIDFISCKKLTYNSVKSILTACAAKTNTDAKTLKFSRTLTDNNGELAALVTACTSKGWTISGLTLN